MAAINDKVYARVHEKAKEHQLTDQELKALDTARNQLNSHGKLIRGLFAWTDLFLSI
jgi:hypothetical protein